MKSGSPSSSIRSSGFTLIELLTVITLVGILTAIAAPSFATLIQRNRISAELATFATDLEFARSEAMKRGLPVSICPSADGTSCLGSNTWHRGWIVFHDISATGTVDTAADTVVRRRIGWAVGDTFVAAPSLTAVTFGRIGFASNLSGNSTVLTARPPGASANATRCLLLNTIGNQRLLSAGSSLCI